MYSGSSVHVRPAASRASQAEPLRIGEADLHTPDVLPVAQPTLSKHWRANGRTNAAQKNIFAHIGWRERQIPSPGALYAYDVKSDGRISMFRFERYRYEQYSAFRRCSVIIRKRCCYSLRINGRLPDLRESLAWQRAMHAKHPGVSASAPERPVPVSPPVTWSLAARDISPGKVLPASVNVDSWLMSSASPLGRLRQRGGRQAGSAAVTGGVPVTSSQTRDEDALDPPSPWSTLTWPGLTLRWPWGSPARWRVGSLVSTCLLLAPLAGHADLGGLPPARHSSTGEQPDLDGIDACPPARRDHWPRAYYTAQRRRWSRTPGCPCHWPPVTSLINTARPPLWRHFRCPSRHANYFRSALQRVNRHRTSVTCLRLERWVQ